MGATVEAPDSAEAYAYPHREGIAWVVNAPETGFNVLRGIRRPDDVDEAVSWARRATERTKAKRLWTLLRFSGFAAAPQPARRSGARR